MRYLALSLAALAACSPLLLIPLRGLRGRSARKAMGVNLAAFFGCMILAALSGMGGVAGAVGPDGAEAAGTADGLRYLGAALAVGLSGIGGGIAVASSAAAALGALSENEKSFGKALIFVGLAEGVALYGLIVALLLLFT